MQDARLLETFFEYVLIALIVWSVFFGMNYFFGLNVCG